MASPRFVVHEHDASHHHFDFRLEVDGVLASWAVPRGPSTDPREKRLAIRVEDHPLDYRNFEGVIPEGEYGAGAVIVWDRGTFRNASTDDEGESIPLARALKRGSATVVLHGKKLRGGYDLVHARVGGEEKNWLLIKVDDDEADARRNPVSTEPESVKSGKTIREVAKEAAGKATS